MLKLTITIIFIMLTSRVVAAEQIPSWQSQYIAKGTEVAIIKLLPGNYDEVGSLIHALAVIDTKETIASLVNISDYYIGSANGADYFALLVNLGNKALPYLETKMNSPAICKDTIKCLSPDVRDKNLARVISAIKTGEKVELVK